MPDSPDRHRIAHDLAAGALTHGRIRALRLPLAMLWISRSRSDLRDVALVTWAVLTLPADAAEGQA